MRKPDANSQTSGYKSANLNPRQRTFAAKKKRTGFSDMVTVWGSFFLARNSFPLQSMTRIGDDSIIQSVCEDNQCTYKRITVRRLHCCINMTSLTTGVLNNDKNSSVWKTEAYVFLLLLMCLY